MKVPSAQFTAPQYDKPGLLLLFNTESERDDALGVDRDTRRPQNQNDEKEGGEVTRVDRARLPAESLTASQNELIVNCPKCGKEQIDQDGFGCLYCHHCGYCTHPSIDGEECNLCGMKIPNAEQPAAVPAAERTEPRQNDQGDWVCQHGTAMDVHCCNCHSGFLFDSRKCVCF